MPEPSDVNRSLSEGDEHGQDPQGSDMLDAIGRNEQALNTLLGRIQEMMHQAGTRRHAMSRTTSRFLFGFLVLIVGTSAFLVYQDKMSDGSFTFLLGVVVGSVIQFLGRFNLGKAE